MQEREWRRKQLAKEIRMNIEEVREYALSLNEQVTEDLFVKSWVSWQNLHGNMRFWDIQIG